jgi:hypothetical protein
MGVNFSGYHENRGKGRRSTDDALAAEEMLRLHHYALSLDGLLELLPLLRAFMKEGETGLQCPIAPAPWNQVTAMFDETLAVGNQPPYPVTDYPVTQLSWEAGYDQDTPSRSATNSRRSPQQNRPDIMGTMVKWCLTKAQQYGYICFTPLWMPYNMTDVGRTADHLRALDFDHCVPWMKSPTYNNSSYWYNTPKVSRMCDEKKAGCFCHKPFHRPGKNRDN